MRLKTPPDCFLSCAEVAQIIGLSEAIIYHHECGTGELTRIKLGRRTVFSFNELQEWMSRKVQKAETDNPLSHWTKPKTSNRQQTKKQ